MKIPKKYLYIPFVSVPVFVIDQVTKLWVDKAFQLHESVVVIPNFFSFTYVRNRGAAFGMFSTASDLVRSWALGIIPLFALFVVGMIYRNVPKDSKLVPAALSLVVGGAIGNMLDRVRLRYVIDFLDFYYPGTLTLPFSDKVIGPLHWPAFNVADSAICVGIGMMTFHMIFIEPKQKNHVAPH